MLTFVYVTTDEGYNEPTTKDYQAACKKDTVLQQRQLHVSDSCLDVKINSFNLTIYL